MLNCWCITWPVGFKRLIIADMWITSRMSFRWEPLCSMRTDIEIWGSWSSLLSVVLWTGKKLESVAGRKAGEGRGCGRGRKVEENKKYVFVICLRAGNQNLEQLACPDVPRLNNFSLADLFLCDLSETWRRIAIFSVASSHYVLETESRRIFRSTQWNDTTQSETWATQIHLSRQASDISCLMKG